jgi:predicted SAM-dependent methyltransferase
MKTIERLKDFRPHEPSAWRSIVHALDARTIYAIVGGKRPPQMQGLQLLNVGCGALRYPGWINADYVGAVRIIRSPENRPNWLLDATKRWNCPDHYFDGIFCQHVIEHFYYPDVITVLAECRRTLKKGCWLRVSVPSIERFLQYELQGFETVAESVSFLAQHSQHISVWSASLLIQILQELGFTEINEVEYLRGSDERLLMDGESKRHNSLFVEART